MKNYRTKSVEMLINAMAKFNSPDEVYAFLDDLCTIKEIQDMAQRFETAILLAEGKSYQKIAETVGVSTATISRVNRCLNYGNGGYEAAIKSISNKGEKNANK